MSIFLLFFLSPHIFVVLTLLYINIFEPISLNTQCPLILALLLSFVGYSHLFSIITFFLTRFSPFWYTLYKISYRYLTVRNYITKLSSSSNFISLLKLFWLVSFFFGEYLLNNISFDRL